MSAAFQDDHVTLPLTRAASADDADLDSHGLVAGVSPRSSPRSSLLSSPRLAPDDRTLFERFCRAWRRVPARWSVERDPHIAFTQLATLCAFVSLFVFVFSVPAILSFVAPRAPTAPGTAPGLDEAASMLSGKRGAVAADHPLCSELGVRVLQEMHGNAVDAMVSTVLCQGILAPFASGLGGGAFILIHHMPTAVSSFYDAREVAPAAAKMVLFKKNATHAKFGGLSIAVPGELRGLYDAHQQWGVLKWKQVVEPTIEIAENAKVGKFLAVKLQQMNETILASPSLTKIFTKKVLTKKAKSEQDAAASVELPGVRRQAGDGDDLLERSAARGVVETLNDDSVVTDANDKDNHGVSAQGATPAEDGNATYTVKLLEEGDEMVNAALVKTLKSVARKGSDAVYQDLAASLAEEIREAGGIMTTEDIEQYRAIVRHPIRSKYHGFEVIGAPLPSAGGVSIAMALNMVRELNFRRKGRNSVTYKLLTETLKWVFGARMGLGDPGFVTGAERQVWSMLNRREALKRVFRIKDDRTFGPKHYSDKITMSRLEDGTSHVSILDSNGTGVAVTSTINLPFGSGVMSVRSGILLNDQMDSFTTSASRSNAYGMYPSKENGVEGGKRPISSMSPTIVLRNGRVYMVLGGSGGPKAVSGVLQTMLNVVDFGDWLADAISAPRVHHQLVPNEVSLEGANGTTCEQTHALQRPSGGNGVSRKEAWKYWESVCKALQDTGHRVSGPAVHGAVQAIVAPAALLNPRQLRKKGADSLIYAASDARRIGKAAVY
ncbi:unnamed protein product [Chondrus crispus]|uniref:Gamma-glutamyltransferase n=1 Tax=Chondrus crispus TaxID=2769 RepID=R7QI32_CHOCR|nr:unnamed protein product [Chondrus crispus]CDF37065.1 unnamed protein product [Chondrus crispus]|eukprot:XP_005716884.1 unnamed protein product [Chondrus crispus]